ncbi:unnamed protein product, partial [Discosporangium mesarthrocarpum]
MGRARQGSFEANPPFVEEVMVSMVDSMHVLLDASAAPMSLAVIVPGWDNDRCRSYSDMKTSDYAR